MLCVNIVCAVLFLLFHVVVLNATCMFKSNATYAICSDLEDVGVWGNAQWKKFNAGKDGKNALTTLKANNFQTTPNLEQIRIFTLVNHIEPGAFDGLDKLDFLQLYKNEITEITVDLFANLPIRQLILYETGIRKLAIGCFNSLPNLSIVNINKNFLPKISAGIFNNLNISKLSLQENGINIIDDGAFMNMNKLTLLALNGNRLTTFEPKYVLGYNRVLTRLWLYQNFLTEVSKDMFFGLPNLEVINLSYNLITEVKDNSFNDVKKVYLIALLHNRLEVLNPGIFPPQGLSSVQKLYIQNNQLTFLSSGVLIRLPNLKTIALGGNPWQCPCFYHLISWLANKNISRTCDDEYFLGHRPVCVVSLTSPKDCVYDVVNSKELVRIYTKAASEYPVLTPCLS